METNHTGELVFLGEEALPPPGVTPRFTIIPAPMEATVSYGRGTAAGPAALLAASRYIELYDEELDSEPWRVGIRTMPIAALEGTPEDIVKAIEHQVSAVNRATLPVVLGGEHTVTLGAVAAAAARWGEFTVVSFDAHADFRDSYEGSPYSHACVMRRVVDYAKVVCVGVRSVSREEVEAIRTRRDYVLITAAQLQELSVEDILIHCGDKVYISIDVDVLDPSIMPATGTPEPGGLEWHRLLSILRGICTERRVIGADVVELAPIPGFHAPEFTVAKLTYKLISFLTERGFCPPP
ncbi:agmatinase [bacterium]|nr:agmatinase [candidate division CSSED10-310 bacterium]